MSISSCSGLSGRTNRAKYFLLVRFRRFPKPRGELLSGRRRGTPVLAWFPLPTCPFRTRRRAPGAAPALAWMTTGIFPAPPAGIDLVLKFPPGVLVLNQPFDGH